MANTPYYVKAETDALIKQVKRQFGIGIVGTVTPNVGGIPQINGSDITENGFYFIGQDGDYGTVTGVSVSDQIPILEVTNIETTTVYSVNEYPITLTIDATPTSGSTNAVQSGGVYDAILEKAPKQIYDVDNNSFPSTMKADADYHGKNADLETLNKTTKTNAINEVNLNANTALTEASEAKVLADAIVVSNANKVEDSEYQTTKAIAIANQSNKTEKGGYTGTSKDLKDLIDTLNFTGVTTYETESDLPTPVPADGTTAKVGKDPDPTKNGDWFVLSSAWVQADSIVDNFTDTDDISKQGTSLKFTDLAKSVDNQYGIYYIPNNFDFSAIPVGYANCRLVIRYQHDFGGNTETFPDDVILDFQGGRFSNGGMNGNNISISNPSNATIFASNFTITEGCLNITSFDCAWYGVKTTNSASSNTARIKKVIEIGTSWHIGTGTFDVNDTLTLKSQSYGYSVKGSGKEKTIFNAIDMLTKPVFNIEKVASNSLLRFNMSDFRVQGDCKNAIHFDPYVPAGAYYASTLRNLQLNSVTGSALRVDESFSVDYQNVYAGSTGGHAFEIKSDIGSSMVNCYATQCGVGKAGYRLYKQMTMISCNGLNDGDIWGHFGGVDQRGINNVYDISSMGANVEDWKVDGLLFEGNSGTATFINTFFLAGTAEYSATFNSYIRAKYTNKNITFINIPTLGTKGSVNSNYPIITEGGDNNITFSGNIASSVLDSDGFVEVRNTSGGGTNYTYPIDNTIKGEFGEYVRDLQRITYLRSYGFNLQKRIDVDDEATTIDASNQSVFRINNTVTTAISEITGGKEGQKISLQFLDDNTTINNASVSTDGIYLNYEGNLKFKAGDVLNLTYVKDKGWKQDKQVLFQRRVLVDDESTTIDASSGTIFKINNTVATNLISITGGVEGQKISLEILDNNTTIYYNSSAPNGILLNVGGNFKIPANSIINLTYFIGVGWKQDLHITSPNRQIVPDGDSTFEVSKTSTGYRINNTTATFLDSVTGGYDGKELILVCKDANTTIRHNVAGTGGFFLKSAGNEVTADGDVYKFIWNDGWKQI